MRYARYLMKAQSLIASSLATCLLASGFLGLAAVVNDASAGKMKRGASSRSFALEMKRRNRGPRIPLPIGPSYLFYDYPYYYSRGHYPTHIGGYVYYPAYVYDRRYYRGPESPRRQSARRHWQR
jgi:hypothetical protein